MLVGANIKPHFHLFPNFFFLRPIPSASKPAEVGDAELVLCPECCSPSLIFVLWGIPDQIVLRDLIWSFIGIKSAVGVPILHVEDGHVDVTLWGVTVKV